MESSATLVAWTAWAAAALGLLLLLSVYSRKHRNLPPGPFSWPLFGSLFLVGKSRHRSLARLANMYGPIMYLDLGCRPHVIISSPEMAKQVLKDQDVEFASRPQYHTFFKHVSHGFNDLVFAPHGDRWKLLRRVSGMELFSIGRVNHFSSVRKRELAAFGTIIQESGKNGQAFDLTLLLHELFTNLMTCVLFGKKFYSSDTPVTPEAARYRAVWDVLVREAERVYIGDFVPSLRWIDTLRGNEKRLKKKILPAVEKFLHVIVEEHKKEFQPDKPPRDFVDVMLSLSGETKLDSETIIALLQNLLVAGTNTSKATVEWGLSELLLNPEVQKKAHEELDRVVGRERALEESDLKDLPYLQAIVKEVLRLHPIATTGLPHSNLEPARLGSYTIPANTTVLVNIWALQRDPGTWKDPERFYPERFVNSEHNALGQYFDFIPFSSGRRRCVGMPLALPHVSLTLAYLLHRFEWKVAEGESIDMTESTGVATVPAKHRIVRAFPRF